MMRHDRELVRRWNQGEKAALRQIYHLYKHDLVTLAHTLLCQKAAADDVVHDVFAKLLDSRRRIRIKRCLRAYLLSAVANTARNRNRESPDWGRIETKEPFSADRPDRLAAQNEQQGRLLRALEQLPYEQREVILLRHYADARFRDIAKQQGLSVNTVQGRYRYGLKKLRLLLNGDL